MHAEIYFATIESQSFAAIAAYLNNTLNRSRVAGRFRNGQSNHATRLSRTLSGLSMKFSIANLLSSVTIVVLAVALIAVTGKRDPVLHINTTTTHGGVHLSRAQMDEAPVWEDRKLAPPMHVGEVIVIASDITNELNRAAKPLGYGDWELAGISISPLTGGFNQDRLRWCYYATFEGSYMFHQGSPLIFEAVILMDGTVVVGANLFEKDLRDAMKKVYP